MNNYGLVGCASVTMRKVVTWTTWTVSVVVYMALLWVAYSV
jgi:hypothetical protein